MHYRAVTTLSMVLLLGTASAPLLAQAPATGASLLTQLEASYNLAKVGFASSRITAPGSVYVVHVEGLLARAIADHVTPTTTIENGQPLPAAKGFSGIFGATGDTRQVAPGERFYLVGIDLKDNAIVFRLDSLDMHGVEENGNSEQSRFRMLIKFPLKKGAADTLTVADVHHLTDPIFSNVDAPAPQVQLGESLADVENAFGQPDRIVVLGSKKVLAYGGLTITFVDDKVSDAN